METVLAVLCGIMAAASIYLMLSGNLIRFIFGLMIATNAVNLLIFVAGRLSGHRPPLIPEAAAVPPAQVANALPQALILTAIVIGFGVQAFAIVLLKRAYQEVKSDDMDKMNTTDT